MNIKQKAQKYLDRLEIRKKNDGVTEFVIIKDASPEVLHEAIKTAHGDKLPDDWIYGTFYSLLEKITEYEIKDIVGLEELRHEIVDSLVDIYNHELLKWLSSDWDNFEKLVESMNSHSYSSEDGAWQVLATTQYESIDEIMQEVINLLSK